MEPLNLFQQAYVNFYGDEALRSDFNSMLAWLVQREFIEDDFQIDSADEAERYSFLLRLWHAYKDTLSNSFPKKYDREHLEAQALEHVDAEDIYELRDCIEECSDVELMVIAQIFDEEVYEDLEQFVDKFFSVSIRWHVDDVKSLRKDLTDLQARHVLEVVEAYHNPNVGMNLRVIKEIADQEFPIK